MTRSPPRTLPPPPPALRGQLPTVRAINDGTPVSLRVINDLVALSRREELQTPPTGRKRFGFTETAEIINGRIAMAAIAFFAMGALPSLLDMARAGA